MPGCEWLTGPPPDILLRTYIDLYLTLNAVRFAFEMLSTSYHSQYMSIKVFIFAKPWKIRSEMLKRGPKHRVLFVLLQKK